MSSASLSFGFLFLWIFVATFDASARLPMLVKVQKVLRILLSEYRDSKLSSQPNKQ
jgi:hypothetical protein